MIHAALICKIHRTQRIEETTKKHTISKMTLADMKLRKKRLNGAFLCLSTQWLNGNIEFCTVNFFRKYVFLLIFSKVLCTSQKKKIFTALSIHQNLSKQIKRPDIRSYSRTKEVKFFKKVYFLGFTNVFQSLFTVFQAELKKLQKDLPKWCYFV